MRNGETAERKERTLELPKRIEAPDAADLIRAREHVCATCTRGDVCTRPGDAPYVICRAEPPGLPGGGSMAADWPQTEPEDWCAKYHMADSDDLADRRSLLSLTEEIGSTRVYRLREGQRGRDAKERRVKEQEKESAKTGR